MIYHVFSTHQKTTKEQYATRSLPETAERMRAMVHVKLVYVSAMCRYLFMAASCNERKGGELKGGEEYLYC